MTDTYLLRLDESLTKNNFGLFKNFQKTEYFKNINKTDEKEFYSLYSFNKEGKEKVKISNLEIHFEDSPLLKNANIYLNNFTENGKKWLSSISDNLAFIYVYRKYTDFLSGEEINEIVKQPIGMLQKFEIKF